MTTNELNEIIKDKAVESVKAAVQDHLLEIVRVIAREEAVLEYARHEQHLNAAPAAVELVVEEPPEEEPVVHLLADTLIEMHGMKMRPYNRTRMINDLRSQGVELEEDLIAKRNPIDLIQTHSTSLAMVVKMVNKHPTWAVSENHSAYDEFTAMMECVKDISFDSYTKAEAYFKKLKTF